ncbi:ABC transporter ATP-binding protein [Tistrella bauzanensis]|jgi:branched-chain amino acid transport system ATP-binding protein|uniref:ABC transporter ATP-binding protein n=2 Tax=Geminicoccaceae TaxID=2066434 RepID=A0ABU9YQY7_9PROT
MAAGVMAAGTVVLKAEGLVKAWGGVRAVDDVSLVVEAGRMLALIGPNGAGKSTCFGLLNGELMPDAGRVTMLGQDVTGWPPRRIRRLGVGRTFQITRIFASMTVRENVQTALIAHAGASTRLFGRADRRHLAEAAALLDRVGLGALALRPAGELAYGDVKRLELAIAIANRPKLLLMDEPTAGMAPAERAGLMQLVAGLVRETGLGVLFTEHDMDAVFAHADRLMVLNRGQVLAEGRPEDVRGDPRVREVYLGGHQPPDGGMQRT